MQRTVRRSEGRSMHTTIRCRESRSLYVERLVAGPQEPNRNTCEACDDFDRIADEKNKHNPGFHPFRTCLLYTSDAADE